MLTQSGRLVLPGNNESPSLEDIAQGLGRIIRWGGQTEEIYSVLAHTLTVCVLLEEDEKVHGLLHDAPEACVSDVVRPWKTKAAEENEADLLRRIYAAYGIPEMTEKQKAAVKLADNRALVAEAHVLRHVDTELLERQIGFPADSEAMELTQINLELVPQLMHAPTAKAIYVEAFNTYAPFATA